MSESVENCDNSALCKICCKIKGKYVCPRCNILYCSLQCYQSETHVNCSESFYQDCVMEEMKSREDEPEAEKKMHEILKRLQENENVDDSLDSDDEDNIPNLHDRMKGVNLNDADSIWEKLTPEEKREFEDLLQSGDASELVTPWVPWWLYRKQKVLVEELESHEAACVDYKSKCPPLNKNIPSFSQISKTAPSPCVKYNVLNVLAAYCYTARFFNGEHHSMPSEASSSLVTLSANLNLNHTYDSAVLAVEAVAHEAVNCSWICGSPESISCMKNDVECIVVGPEYENCQFYLQAALSDAHKLLSEAKNVKLSEPIKGKKHGGFTKRFSDASTSLIPKDKLKLCIKKLEYYLSWSQAFYKDICFQSFQL